MRVITCFAASTDDTRSLSARMETDIGIILLEKLVLVSCIMRLNKEYENISPMPRTFSAFLVYGWVMNISVKLYHIF